MESGSRSLTLGELAGRLGGRLGGGDPASRVTGAAPVEEAGPLDVTMALSPRYMRALSGRRAGVVIVPAGRPIDGQAFIEVADPRAAFDQVLEYFAPEAWEPSAGIDATASVSPDATLERDVRVGARAFVGRRAHLGQGVTLFPGVVVGDDVRIGPGSVLFPNVVVQERVVIGARVRIGAGSVIGSQGFGFRSEGMRHRRRPQIGTVILEDDVEIGANSCVDRASVGATVVGKGSKVDNLVQIAHNVRIGPGCLVVGQTGIAGSTRVGAGVVLAGQVGVTDHVEIGDRVVAFGRSMIVEDVPAGARVAGQPAFAHGETLRIWALWRRLPELWRRVARLETLVAGPAPDEAAGPDRRPDAKRPEAPEGRIGGNGR